VINLKNKLATWLIVIIAFIYGGSGCATKTQVAQETIDHTITESDVYGKSKKYIKSGITVVYLTGTPYEIGFAHGKLCKREIQEVNKPFFEAYDRLERNPENSWLKLSKKLEKNVPEEYVEKMRGIAEGAEIDYDKILFLNTLSTISMVNGCFAFSFNSVDSRIFTIRQIDGFKKSDLYRKMILFVVKPEKGYGFAAILNPGWVDGETGMNENGITVSQNNIGIKQDNWNVTPITHLSRYMLQYSGTIDDIERMLDKEKAYPARLIFASSKDGASAFEFANEEKARINMKDGFLALSNHARLIPSRKMGSGSVKRLEFASEFFTEHINRVDIEKAIELARSPRISRSLFWDSSRVHNRQSFVFSPDTLDFWIAIPPKSGNKPASSGPYIGFNLLNELYETGDRPNPPFFPAVY
jgi:hypothetical protein